MDIEVTTLFGLPIGATARINKEEARLIGKDIMGEELLRLKGRKTGDGIIQVNSSIAEMYVADVSPADLCADIAGEMGITTRETKEELMRGAFQRVKEWFE